MAAREDGSDLGSEYEAGYMKGVQDGLRLGMEILKDRGLAKPGRLFPPARIACATCGLIFDGPMGYVCPRSDCPGSLMGASPTAAATAG